MSLLADEGVDSPVVEALRSAGIMVVYIAELHPGLDDESILAMAVDSRSILMTCDKDFGELVFRQRRLTHGVVLLRLGGLSMPHKIAVTLDAFQKHMKEFEAAFSVVELGKVRVRKAL